MALVLNGNGTVTGFVGGVQQSLSATQSDVVSTTSTSFTDITGLSVDITPSSTSNKILVHTDFIIGGVSDSYVFIRLVRVIGGSTTVIDAGDTEGSRTSCLGLQYSVSTAHGWYAMRHQASSFLDSPNSTSTCTYKLQFFTNGGTPGGYVNRQSYDTDSLYVGRGQSNITVMEIGG
jgi:hypothetical protein